MLINDHVKYYKYNIPENIEITHQYNQLKENSFMGSQYDWLARLAHYHHLYGLELCIHKDDKAEVFLRNNVEQKYKGTELVHVLKSYNEENPLNLFKYFTFPLLDYSKLEMANQAKENGFSYIMEMTWFCFNPTKSGEPCGLCNPCKYTKEEGLSRRVPRPRMSTLVNHYFKKITQKFKVFVKTSLKIKWLY